MRGGLAWALAALTAARAGAQTAVSVPWEEVKQWHEESVERKIMEKLGAAKAPREPQVHSVEEVRGALRVGAGEARGKLLISGRTLSGDPAPIRLFGADTVVEGVAGLQGGMLLPSDTSEPGLFFLPTNHGPFQVELDVILPVVEEAGARFVLAQWPQAVTATVTLEVDAGLRMVEQPGHAAGAPGRYRLPAGGRFAMRLEDAALAAKAQPVEMDLLTQVRVVEGKARLRTWLWPVRATRGAIEIGAPAGARLIESSLPDSRIRPQTNGAWVVDGADPAGGPIALEFSLPGDAAAGIGFALPAVRDNRGREGFFWVAEPPDGEVELQADGMQKDIAPAKLAPALARAAGSVEGLAHVPPGRELRLVCRPFRPVARPAVVLESLEFEVAFEESGAALIRLRATVPPEVGRRLYLRAVPDADIWSLKVGGVAQSVYADGRDRWVIPMMDGKPSAVELELLRKGEKLGLSGRAEVVLPETGLSAQVVQVRLSLPERVDLLSLEGPLTAAPGGQGGAGPAGGRRTYSFAKAFYKGEAVPVAVLYKEPVKAGVIGQ